MSDTYYYDAPPDFTPDETVEIVVPMEQPPEWYRFQSIIDEYEKDKKTFIRSVAIFTTIIYGKTYANGITLPYPLGAQVGVRETYIDLPYKVKAVRHWYTVTAVDVVQRKGQWVEKVTMRREM